MYIRPRIIPVLLLEDNRLVKTVRFKKPSYVGDPINAAKIFNEKCADELVILDILASKKKREPNYSILEKIANECFMPLTYGGGIYRLDQALKIFSIGFEKICINSAFIENINFIKELVKKFGSQSVVLSIDIKKNFFNNYKLYSHSNLKINYSWKNFLIKAVDLGIGEVILNSVDMDGTRQGMDFNLINIISNFVNVPIVACGGVDSIDDIYKGIKNGASGIGAGSLFVYNGPLKGVLISYLSEDEIESLVK